MSYQFTKKTMYVRDPRTGELVPISMVASGANEAIADIQKAAQNAKSAIDANVKEALENVPDLKQLQSDLIGVVPFFLGSAPDIDRPFLLFETEDML